MSTEPNLKPTDLDYLVGSHHLQMMKAALPYMKANEQKTISLFVKLGELFRTIELFEDEEVATMGICSLEEQKKSSPLDMLGAIKPYANTREQELIDLISNIMQSSGKPPLDQLKAFLSPEQQSQMDYMQLIMQMTANKT